MWSPPTETVAAAVAMGKHLGVAASWRDACGGTAFSALPYRYALGMLPPRVCLPQECA